MDEKQKYRNLLYNLNIIKDELSEIVLDIDEFQKYLKENLNINNKIAEKDKINNIKFKVNETYNDLVYNLIPTIKNKTY